MPKDILHDQAGIWTSPARIHTKDLIWLAPLAAATGVSIATDSHTMRDVVSHDPDFNNANVNVANGLTGGLVAIPAALYGFGLLNNDSHQRETGILSGEAVLDAYIVQFGLKLVTWRERPQQNNAEGHFFQSSAGIDSSFPSNHSIIAWSSAAVIASEYPSPWVQLGVYSMATGVSLTRVMGQQHFPTDVLIGSTTSPTSGTRQNILKPQSKNIGPRPVTVKPTLTVRNQQLKPGHKLHLLNTLRLLPRIGSRHENILHHSKTC